MVFLVFRHSQTGIKIKECAISAASASRSGARDKVPVQPREVWIRRNKIISFRLYDCQSLKVDRDLLVSLVSAI